MKLNAKLYQDMPQMVLGFHGCDRSVAEKVLRSQEEHLHPSTNTYDWLGDGVYFWLNDPQRALEWAEQTKQRGKINDPFVIGAVIDLGFCLNLCERKAIDMLKSSYAALETELRMSGKRIDEVFQNRAPDEGGFRLIRPLDCAVIRNLHRIMKEIGQRPFDSVYGYFQEGKDAFPGGGIKEKSHIQICVRNTACIKGYFLPRL